MRDWANYKRYEEIMRDTRKLWEIRANYKKYEEIMRDTSKL
jgi:hypothetical protein